MRCPKCHYLGFEPEPRCRNCGYDLALADDDLLMRPDDEAPNATMPDLELRRREDPAPKAPVLVEEAPPPRRPLAFEPPRRTRRTRVAPSTTAEMPLFVKSVSDAAADEPLVQVPSRPRKPLGVRRTQDTPRPRPGNGPSEALGPFEQDLLEDFRRLEARVVTQARAEQSQGSAMRPVDGPHVANAGRRVAAAAIDALLMGSISVGVFGATLRVADLNFGQAGDLPVVPFAVFLLIVAMGYLLMFTLASGQTVGKMLTGLRVVGTAADGRSDEPLTVQQAALRTLLVVPSVLALGAGFLPAMVGRHRAIHDRLSQTRVVLV